MYGKQVVGVSYGYNPYGNYNSGTGTLIFDGSNGYGVLTNNTVTGDYGNCNMTSWPMCNTISTAHAYGIGLRGGGGGVGTGAGRLQTSDRAV